ncbi:MAG TPA: metallophosphoesterase, partial [Gemmatales bacterium]|nr:metallophosphoesterase [Gemmatales bacterium]
MTQTTRPAITKDPKLTRRRWLRRCLGYGSLAALGFYTWRIEPHWIDLVERPLPLKHLPASLVGKRLIQLSDIHIGRQVDPDYIRHALELVNSLAPDLLVITGDFMTYASAQQLDEVPPIIQTLKQPSLGCFAVLGNHDYGREWKE